MLSVYGERGAERGASTLSRICALRLRGTACHEELGWSLRGVRELSSVFSPTPPLAPRHRPVITINKLDRAFLELQLPTEDMYTHFVKHVENVNVLVSTYHDDALGDVQVDPTKGTVGFSAGLHGWAFTLTKFARMYAKKFGVDIEKMMQRLWGASCFNAKEKKWIKQADGQVPQGLERAFCMFCLCAAAPLQPPRSPRPVPPTLDPRLLS